MLREKVKVEKMRYIGLINARKDFKINLKMDFNLHKAHTCNKVIKDKFEIKLFFI